MELDKMGRDALWYAIAGCEDRALKMLKRAENINFQDSNGYSYLHIAVQEGFPKAVDRLIKLGCMVDLRDKFGRTPLWIAVSFYNGDDAVIQKLIEAGADVNAENNHGVSCMALAQKKGYDGLCK
ncbi:MAG: ankyrin repeat domain-containing protein [Lachnospiraceae bacterium]|nr:ankyrin repeat domain-containing protein [Lachnospiraceae bacterium]